MINYNNINTYFAGIMIDLIILTSSVIKTIINRFYEKSLALCSFTIVYKKIVYHVSSVRDDISPQSILKHLP